MERLKEDLATLSDLDEKVCWNHLLDDSSRTYIYVSAPLMFLFQTPTVTLCCKIDAT
uniref:Uncharacterized protein n=1 Tax=Anguilla anguilla TaxID=7936 RepID=A0A0E9SB46_ANGAN